MLPYNGVFELIDPNEIHFDHKYQRTQKWDLIAAIAAEPNWGAFGVVICAKREHAGGLLYCLDGQQRITSVGRFLTGKFAIRVAGKEQTFSSLPIEDQELLKNSTLLVYECQGTEKEIKEWFQTINIVGPAAQQAGTAQLDLLRALHHQGEGRVQQLQQRRTCRSGRPTSRVTPSGRRFSRRPWSGSRLPRARASTPS